MVVVAGVILWLVITSRIRTRHDPEYLKLYVNTDAWVKEQADYAAKMEKSSKRSSKKDMGEAQSHTTENGVEVVDLGNFSGEETVVEPEDDGTIVAGEKTEENSPDSDTEEQK